MKNKIQTYLTKKYFFIFLRIFCEEKILSQSYVAETNISPPRVNCSLSTVVNSEIAEALVTNRPVDK